jgi:hypothetical protein
MESATHRYYEVDNDSRPNTILECHSIDGTVDQSLYLQYMQKQSELHDLERHLVEGRREASTEVSSQSSGGTRKKRHSAKSLCPYYFNEQGEHVYLQPKQTVWYHM